MIPAIKIKNNNDFFFFFNSLNRLPFGTNKATEIYQNISQKNFGDISVLVCTDDILRYKIQ